MKSLLTSAAGCLALLAAVNTLAAPGKIDRHALVSRHDVGLTNFDATNPLSVGNGQFCFTVDATGLQTFPEAFENTTPLGTLSDWGWHTIPNTNGWDIDKFQFKLYTNLLGRAVPYADVPHNLQTPETKWLRGNPHRLHLGQIGFVLKHADGSPATTNDLNDIRQRLDLWDGEIISQFKFDGQPVDVETVCDPNTDAVAVRVKSALLKQGRLAIQIHFPYGTGDVKTADWIHPDAHETHFTMLDAGHGMFRRKLDNDEYTIFASWSRGAKVIPRTEHEFLISSKDRNELSLTMSFNPGAAGTNVPPAPFPGIESDTRSHWNKFWKTGGAIDLSGSTDPRWFELERRIVLSQYLTAIQDAGQNPPQETGLTYNSWEGKFHLEMHWWHEAHSRCGTACRCWKNRWVTTKKFFRAPKARPKNRAMTARAGRR
jgi:hypothetical protein